MLNESVHRKAGMVLAYVSILISATVGVAFTPYMISSLGEVEYGLYEVLHATIGYIALLDFGLGGTLTRFMLKYKADGDEGKVNSVVTISIKIYCLFGAVAMLLMALLAVNLDRVFPDNITEVNLAYAQKLLILMGASTSLSFISHALAGIQSAHEKHLVIKGVYIARQLLRVLLIYLLLQLDAGAMAVVLADLAITVILLIFDVFYCKVVLRTPLLRGKWENALFKSLASYSAYVFIQILITQTNNGLDRVLLGRFSTFEVVALYGVVMQLYNLFNSVGGVISGITLPQISKAVFAGVSREELTDICVRYSRFQLYISALLLGGFCLLGKSFAAVWMPEYDSTAIWVLALLIVTPQMLEMVEGTVFNVMKAKNMQKTRSLILLSVMIAHVILTIALLHVYPIYGPALGTCISFVIGNNILSNIYYHKKVGVDMLRYFKKLLQGILPAWVLSVGVGLLILCIPIDGWLGFFVKGCLYVLVYAVCILIIGLNEAERRLVSAILRKIRR